MTLRKVSRHVPVWIMINDTTTLTDVMVAFCTGTAAEIAPIARLATGEGEDNFEKVFDFGQTLPGGPVTAALLKLLRQVMMGEKSSANTEGWLRYLYATPEEFANGGSSFSLSTTVRNT